MIVVWLYVVDSYCMVVWYSAQTRKKGSDGSMS